MGSPLDNPTMQGMIDEANALFEEQCFKRHEMGAEKYGPVRFLEPDNDLFKMLQDELIDAANYARYLFVRLTIMQQMFDGGQVVHESPLGAGAVTSPYSTRTAK